MVQYLTEIKILVDNIGLTGAKIDVEDIVLYTLNGLPSQYQSFKIAIRTQLNLINLKDLYSLLISEEIDVANDNAKEGMHNSSHTTFYIGKGKKPYNMNKNRSKEQYHKPMNRNLEIQSF